MPLALPLMCGPGAIATILGMTTLIKHSEVEVPAFVATALAILATMFVTYLCLAYAGKLVDRLGPMGIDAITRIVGFFVSAIGARLPNNRSERCQLLRGGASAQAKSAAGPSETWGDL